MKARVIWNNGYVVQYKKHWYDSWESVCIRHGFWVVHYDTLEEAKAKADEIVKLGKVLYIARSK